MRFEIVRPVGGWLVKTTASTGLEWAFEMARFEASTEKALQQTWPNHRRSVADVLLNRLDHALLERRSQYALGTEATQGRVVPAPSHVDAPQTWWSSTSVPYLDQPRNGRHRKFCQRW